MGRWPINGRVATEGSDFTDDDVARLNAWAAARETQDVDVIAMCSACSSVRLSFNSGEQAEALCADCRAKAQAASAQMYFALRDLYETVMKHNLFQPDDEEIEQASFALRQVDGRRLPD